MSDIFGDNGGDPYDDFAAELGEYGYDFDDIVDAAMVLGEDGGWTYQVEMDDGSVIEYAVDDFDLADQLAEDYDIDYDTDTDAYTED